MNCTCVSFLKIYLFIAPTCFGYSLAIIKVLVIWYSGRTMCIFSNIQLLTLVFFSFSLPCVKIINKILTNVLLFNIAVYSGVYIA